MKYTKKQQLTIKEFFEAERKNCNKWNNTVDSDDYIPFHEWLMDSTLEYSTEYGIDYNRDKEKWDYNGWNKNYVE